MLQAALAYRDPVIIFEHMNLYNMQGERTLPAERIDIDHAAVRRAGRDVTLITYGASLYKCFAAAEQLATQGIEAEIVDLRTLRPPIADFHRFRAGRIAIVVGEGWRSIGIAEIECGSWARSTAHRPYMITASKCRSYTKHMEDAALPQVDGSLAIAAL
jgi:pyruvate/2-oxoglutarate/acetoin dehydrogenase E1 component